MSTEPVIAVVGQTIQARLRRTADPARRAAPRPADGVRARTPSALRARSAASARGHSAARASRGWSRPWPARNMAATSFPSGRMSFPSNSLLAPPAFAGTLLAGELLVRIRAAGVDGTSGRSMLAAGLASARTHDEDVRWMSSDPTLAAAPRAHRSKEARRPPIPAAPPTDGRGPSTTSQPHAPAATTTPHAPSRRSADRVRGARGASGGACNGQSWIATATARTTCRSPLNHVWP